MQLQPLKTVSFPMDEPWVLATHNAGKLAEFQEMFAPYDIEIISAGDLGLPEPEETGKTFEENAALKALAAAKASGKVALADDSGICVNALGGEPGIYSARWAVREETGQRDFAYAMERVQEALRDAKDRSAYFVAMLALATPEGEINYFEGRTEGMISWPPRGLHGFGYDPVFIPDGYEKTFGEMLPEQKKELSHRARAFQKLKDSLF